MADQEYEEELTPEEAARLLAEADGFEETELSPEEIAALGLDVPQAPPPPPEGVDPGRWSTAWHAFLAGALKQGSDEVVGEAVQRLAPDGIGIPQNPNSVYRKARDSERQVLEQGRAAHPVLSFLGNVGGDVASDYLLSKAGLPVATQGYQLATGALSGLLGGTAELTSDKRTPQDMARAVVDTGLGTGLAWLAPKVGQGLARAGGKLLPRARAALERAAVNQGRRVIGGDSDIAAATREALPDEAVLRVLQEKLIRPLSTTGATYKRIDDAAEQVGATYGAILQELEAQGVTGPRATSLAAEFMRRANEMRSTVLPGNTSPQIMAKTARELGRQGQTTSALPLSVAEALKRDAQKMGRHERLRNTPGEEAYQEIGSKMRQAIEDSIDMAGREAGPGSDVAHLADGFKPTKERLSQLLAARNVGERGASKALQKSPVSLKDYLLGAAAGNPGTAAAAAFTSSTIRNRLPSTLASGAYGLSRLAKAGAAHPEELATAGGRAAASVARNPAVLEALAEWLVSPTDLSEARLEALRRQQKENR